MSLKNDPLATVLLVGGGARSHALGHALDQSPSVKKVVFAPGTSGLEALGYETAPVATQDFAGLVEHALLEEYDLTVVGPNTPLVDGIVDTFQAADLPIFGPSRAAAKLEGSKVHARLLMSHLGIATPKFAICDNVERAAHLAHTRPWARVFKTDGIAYGKGVRVTHARDEVEGALNDILVDNVYGLESERIVVEERLDGDEVTVFCLTDGKEISVLGHVHNYPRLLDANNGPPTRGMGQVCPAPEVDASMMQQIMQQVLEPTISELRDQGRPMVGALFVDFMLVGALPYAIDYNVRFGDPATQTILSGISGDFYLALKACVDGHGLSEAVNALHIDPRPRVSVVITCAGYPERFERGAPIHLNRDVFDTDPDLWLFQDGVRIVEGSPVTTGGRTYTVVAAGDTPSAARSKVYASIGEIKFAGMHFRQDIGMRLP
jgi:phosphoribosylamine--glycine ligase